MTRHLRNLTVVLMTAVVAASVVAIPAVATPPSNDAEDGATIVDAVPFTVSPNTAEATAGGPRFCSTHASVFYTFTPNENARIQVDTLGSEYDTTLAIFTRDAAGRVQPIACNDDRFWPASGLRLRAVGGTTYVIMVGRCCGSPDQGRPGRPGGPLVLSVTEVPEVPLEVMLDVVGGTVDAKGIASISGTISCTKRATVYAEGLLRQLRQGLFVARAYWWAQGVCGPGEPMPLTIEIDTESGVAFGSGPATVRRNYLSGYAGWREWIEHDETEVIPLQLV